MDANQLIKSLADAAAASKPQLESCLLGIDWWPICMTKAEWAGWMQAIGTVAAIAGAAWIASRQERNARRTSKQLAIRKARTALAGLIAVAELVREKGSLWQADAVPKRRLAEEHLNIARSIEADQLHLSWTVQVVALRSLGVQLISALERFENSKPRQIQPGLAESASHSQLLNCVAEIEAGLLGVQAVIRNSHPGIAAYED